MRKNREPKYSLHKATGQARVCIDGTDHYLGKYESPESYRKYQELIDGWRLRQRYPVRQEITIVQLILRYDDHVGEFYQKNGEPTSSVCRVRSALKPLSELFGRISVDEFGPLKLSQVRDRMVARGLARVTVNEYVSQVCRMFKWAVSQELVSPHVYHGLLTLEGLESRRVRRRRDPRFRDCEARE